MASLNLILLSLAWAFRPLWIQQFDNNSVTTLLHKRRYPAYDTITLDGCSPPVNNHPFTIVAHPLDLIMRLRHPSRWPRPLPWIPGRLRPVRILNRLKTSCARSFAFRGDYLICSFLSIAILLRTLLHHGRRSSSIFCISHIVNPCLRSSLGPSQEAASTTLFIRLLGAALLVVFLPLVLWFQPCDSFFPLYD